MAEESSPLKSFAVDDSFWRFQCSMAASSDFYDFGDMDDAAANLMLEL
jgi:hypothetical protein